MGAAFVPSSLTHFKNSFKAASILPSAFCRNPLKNANSKFIVSRLSADLFFTALLEGLIEFICASD
jgi:hypothetical protein